MDYKKVQEAQEAFAIIERLAGLCATIGVSESTKTTANSMITSLMESVVKPAVTKLKADAAGIIN